MTDNLELQMDAYLPLRDVVFQTLRGAILKGDLKPGERLMELQLASKLGVSRTPIREAIRMLEQEGLAVTIPRKGAEVAKMTEKDMEDVLEIRLSLEGLAVRLSCEKITPAALQELKVAMEDFEAKTRSGQFVEMAKADVKFHEILYKASNNPIHATRHVPILFTFEIFCFFLIAVSRFLFPIRNKYISTAVSVSEFHLCRSASKFSP